MISLIQNANVFAPTPLGRRDILICGGKIGAISEPGEIMLRGIDIQIVDAKGRIGVPGFIDSHVHMLGGGGEGGPSTRAPEIKLEDILWSGVATVIGCLGTDGTTRHMESLLAKARSLEIEGISTYIYSGSYQIPVVTLTGNIRSDLVLIDKVIGAGEIAISDHRSSQPTFEEIARLASECRVGGMLAGKAGILHLHVGDSPRRLELLFRLIKETEIPAITVIPTHVNRNPQLMEEAIAYVLEGGYIDLTAGPDPATEDEDLISIAEAIRLCQEKKAPLSRITVSSDSNGSFPVFDMKGNLVGLTIATEESLLKNFQHLIKNRILTPEQALRIFSTNSAHFYKLDGKGEIRVGNDADLLLFDEDWNITDFFVCGRRMISEKKLIARGTFSPVLRA